MAKGLARTFGQDLMRGEHEVGAQTNAETNNGVLMPSHTSGDPGFDAKKRAREAELSRELTTEEFLSRHYEASDAPTASGTSIFDPALCEIAYRWFCPQGGTVLDPFAGGSVRGIVASRLGRRYVGIELRPEQVEANRAQLAFAADPLPDWRVGDARNLRTIASDVAADLIFSCPPYWNLERYSDDPADLSTMDEAAFFEAQASIIAAAVARLKDDRFAVWVVGDVRDARGFYVNLPGRTVEAFEAAGARFYNEAILVTAVGSLPIRTGRQFTAARKLGRTHRSVLVFVKGDPRRATEACGEVEFGEIETELGPDRYRFLSSRASSEAGRYRPDRTPYMRGVMDALSPGSSARRIVFMKAAQVGATEAGNNWIGYCIHQAPGPFLGVQPTTDLAKRLSQQRIEPLIDESPELRALILPSRSRDSGNTVLCPRNSRAGSSC